VPKIVFRKAGVIFALNSCSAFRSRATDKANDIQPTNTQRKVVKLRAKPFAPSDKLIFLGVGMGTAKTKRI
jgi:hypothetical protein